MAIKFAAKDDKPAPSSTAKATATKAADPREAAAEPKLAAQASTPTAPVTDLFNSDAKASGRKRKTK